MTDYYRMEHGEKTPRAGETAGKAPGKKRRPAAKRSSGGSSVLKSGAGRSTSGKGGSKGGLFAVLGILALVIIFSVMPLVQLSVLGQFFPSAVLSTTYPADDRELTETENRYKRLEDTLSEKVRQLARGNYDEVRYDLDSVHHDPYVLISALTALLYSGDADHKQEWDSFAMSTLMSELFTDQYTVSKDVRTETRYRTEKKTVERRERDPETGEIRTRRYTVEERVPYDYVICTVSLVNNGLDRVAVSRMDPSERERYETYMYFLGNRPDLFPGHVPGYETEGAETE